MIELETFKVNINLLDFVYSYGFVELDKMKSSRACTILRRGDDKIGVSRDIKSNHWIYFDIRKACGGTIIDFVQNETSCNLGKVRMNLRQWQGISQVKADFPTKFKKPFVAEHDRLKSFAEFSNCYPVKNYHSYLERRNLNSSTYLADRFSNSLFADKYKNIVFPHYDTEGLCGLEKKNNEFCGFSRSGKKGLWFSRSKPNDQRFVFGESGIDILSYYQLKDDGVTRYFSFCGALSDDIQIPLLKVLVKKYPAVDFVLALDNDKGGLDLITKITSSVSEKKFSIDLPEKNGEDWNAVLANY